MQALSCGSPLVTGGGIMVFPEELEKPEVVNPVNIRVAAASKTDLGTPKRAAPSGSRVCPTPRSVQAPAGEMRTRASQTQESLQVDVADLENEPTIVPSFTTYSNPAFEPLDIIGSTPLKAPKQPPCIPVDSNGLRLCPTPKSTRSSTSSGASKLRVPKATAFQPLETIPSPTVAKDQAKRVGVLGDSNGQWTQETPKASKQVVITPRGGRPATSCAENIAPRALFNNSSASIVKKRARAGEDEVPRTTRSKTEAEKIATFLRSPAARVRSDGTREEYRLGVSGDELVKKFMEKKMLMEKGCQCDTTTACIGCNALSKESPSLAARSTPLLRSPFVRTPTTASRCARTTTPQGSAKKNLSVLLEAQK